MTDYPEAKPDADNAALKESMAYVLAREDYAETYKAKLQEETWFDVAAHAAYQAQCDNLKLTARDEPPCVVSATSATERDKTAQRLLRRMLQAGVSRYHPDPMTALAAAKRRRKLHA